MREILFRGKRVNNGEWVEGSLLRRTPLIATYASNDTSIPGYICEVIPESVGEYTGLRDKNGKKIFEHDIVRIAVCGTYDNYVISYDKENARFVVGDTGFAFWSYISTKIEVIGNIHDNPELLKGEIKNVN